MKLRDWLILFILGVATAFLIAQFEHSPGYMDAEYYYGGGVSLAQGNGFTEPFIWNYLDNPSGIPHPSHTYWMPLASILSAIFPSITGFINFSTSRLIFILLAGCIPLVTTKLAYEISGTRFNAYIGGFLSIFPGFYLPYYATTDTFVPYILLGGAFILLVGKIAKRKASSIYGLGLGLIAGCMHLARADGILWLFVALVTVSGYTISKEGPNQRFSALGKSLGLVLGGYLLIMGPWMARNYLTTGALLSKAGAQTLFLTRYDELYGYPPGKLTLSSWLASGFNQILSVRLYSLWSELKVALGVQTSIFLLPLILMGIWKFRRDGRILAGVSAWMLTLLVMSFVFPFAGSRGGFLHSGAAIQPLWWALAPVGLTAFIQWGTRVRNWNYRQASRFFTPALVGLALFYSAVVSIQLIIGSEIANPAWEQSWGSAKTAELALVQSGAGKADILMVNNPPGYTTATGRKTIAIPDGDINDILSAAKYYGATYLLLEFNHVVALEDLYNHPKSIGGLELLYHNQDIRVFRIAK